MTPPALTLEALQAELRALRHDTQARIDELQAEVAALKAAAAAASDEITPDELVMIAAAVTTYLGLRVRIRSARRVDAPAAPANAWGQHGRVFVQAAAHAMQRGPR